MIRRITLLTSFLLLTLLSIPAEATRVGAQSPMEGTWTLKGVLKDYEPGETKPLVNKLSVVVQITDLVTTDSSDITISGNDGTQNFTLTGKRYGKRFFARSDSMDGALFVSGTAAIVKKTGLASSLSGYFGSLDGVSIGEMRFTAKRFIP